MLRIFTVLLTGVFLLSLSPKTAFSQAAESTMKLTPSEVTEAPHEEKKDESKEHITLGTGENEPNEAYIEEDKESRYVYEEPSMEKFSQLYWTLNLLQLENDTHIDNFMMINECDIYKNYYQHEFEWKKVREATREYIKKNKKNFPLRFQFVQPLRLGAYNIEKQEFDIVEDYRINGTRLFEVVGLEPTEDVCDSNKPIEGYPRAIAVELSRPFSLTHLPMPMAEANDYISKKLELFRAIGKLRETQENVYQARDAYLVMKVKIFVAQGETRTQEGFMLPNTLAVLERVDIYSDPDLKELMYTENFRKRKKKSEMEQNMKKDFETRKNILNTSPAPKAQPQDTPLP
jgi:hypothetical protein